LTGCISWHEAGIYNPWLSGFVDRLYLTISDYADNNPSPSCKAF
jgi:hypothetical protein